MRNLKEMFVRFMSGRYGIDHLYYASVAVYFILFAVNIFFHSAVIGLLMWAILILIIFRVLSKNTYKRRMENQVFLNILNRVKSQSALTVRRVKEIKTHRFRRCPHCKTVLRLPRKTGKHIVECPRCHKEFTLHIFI